MTGKDRIILQKIKAYIDDVIQYIYEYSFDQFMTDKKTISACAFTVSQIGELANDISLRTQEEYSYIPWKSIRGMRNKIVHDYENIDFTVLWGTIKTSLPELLNQIDEIFNREAGEVKILTDADEI
jgi:uncharacterized protein with HEPN domain